uniref:Uncharacterized protein n=1 Tax=Anguilla anguilla TaxID=7936 RepID=A0A0E9WFU8_ANGAN
MVKKRVSTTGHVIYHYPQTGSTRFGTRKFQSLFDRKNDLPAAVQIHRSLINLDWLTVGHKNGVRDPHYMKIFTSPGLAEKEHWSRALQPILIQ